MQAYKQELQSQACSILNLCSSSPLYSHEVNSDVWEALLSLPKYSPLVGSFVYRTFIICSASLIAFLPWKEIKPAGLFIALKEATNETLLQEL